VQILEGSNEVRLNNTLKEVGPGDSADNYASVSIKELQDNVRRSVGHVPKRGKMSDQVYRSILIRIIVAESNKYMSWRPKASTTSSNKGSKPQIIF